MSTRPTRLALLLLLALVPAAAPQMDIMKQPASSVTNQIRLPAPDFHGKTYDQAWKFNETAYKVDGRGRPFFSRFNAVNQTNGTVISQIPLAHTLVAPGGTVTLIFSQSPISPPASIIQTIAGAIDGTITPKKGVEVPYTIGSAGSDAIRILNARNLQGTIGGGSRTDPVYRSDPVAGVAVPRDSLVTVYTRPVPAPPRTVLVPSLYGLSLDGARLALNSKDLYLRHVDYTHTRGPGGVTEQSLLPNTPVIVGAWVNITLAETLPPPPAPHLFRVPQLISSTVAEARTALEARDLSLGTISPEKSSTSAEITDQHPEEGAMVDRGTSVNVIVQTSVPDLTGLSTAAAAAAIVGRHLVPGFITGPSDGTVSAQSLPAEESVPVDTQIGITLSRSTPPIPFILASVIVIAGGLFFFRQPLSSFFRRLGKEAASILKRIADKLDPRDPPGSIPPGILTAHALADHPTPTVRIKTLPTCKLVLTLHDVTAPPGYDLTQQPGVTLKPSSQSEQP